MIVKQIKSWIEEVERDNFPSEERQAELCWNDYICSCNVLDVINRLTMSVVTKLNKDIQEEYAIGFSNDYQKENYGGWLNSYYLVSADRRNLVVTKHDYTQMYRYNIYDNGKKIAEIDETEDLVKWLNENL